MKHSSPPLTERPWEEGEGPLDTRSCYSLANLCQWSTSSWGQSLTNANLVNLFSHSLGKSSPGSSKDDCTLLKCITLLRKKVLCELKKNQIELLMSKGTDSEGQEKKILDQPKVTTFATKYNFSPHTRFSGFHGLFHFCMNAPRYRESSRRSKRHL